MSFALCAGTTELGRGAVVAFHPDAWPAAEAARLLQALRVVSDCACSYPSSARVAGMTSGVTSMPYRGFTGVDTVQGSQQCCWRSDTRHDATLFSGKNVNSILIETNFF